uniref:BH3-interacting domain death agonist n=1 Tax=Maylandia zebra TaxID=106582 RepID=A0A3P9CIW2_9CICH
MDLSTTRVTASELIFAFLQEGHESASYMKELHSLGEQYKFSWDINSNGQSVWTDLFVSAFQNWKDYLAFEVERVMMRWVGPDLPWERVIIALALTLVKRVYFFKCFKTTLYLNLCTDITNLLCNMDTLDSFLVSIENIKNTIHFYRSLFMKVSDLLTGRKI